VDDVGVLLARAHIIPKFVIGVLVYTVPKQSVYDTWPDIPFVAINCHVTHVDVGLDNEIEGVGVGVLEGVTVGVVETVCDGVAVIDGVGVIDDVGVWLGVIEGVPVGVANGTATSNVLINWSKLVIFILVKSAIAAPEL